MNKYNKKNFLHLLIKILIFFLIPLTFFGCSKIGQEIAPTLTAEIIITDTTQDYYSSLNKYGTVEVHYKITNTGNLNIDYYKVYIKVTCADGSTYTEWDNGLDVNVGKELSDYTYINTANKQYSKIEIVDKELTHY